MRDSGLGFRGWGGGGGGRPYHVARGGGGGGGGGGWRTENWDHVSIPSIVPINLCSPYKKPRITPKVPYQDPFFCPLTVTLTNAANPMNPVHHVKPVNPTNPANPVNTTNPMNPIKP